MFATTIYKTINTLSKLTPTKRINEVQMLVTFSVYLVLTRMTWRVRAVIKKNRAIIKVVRVWKRHLWFQSELRGFLSLEKITSHLACLLCISTSLNSQPVLDQYNHGWAVFQWTLTQTLRVITRILTSKTWRWF